MKKRFYLDRQNKKLFGVSAGIADYTGVDATIVRVALVLLTLAGGFPWTIIAYFIAAAMAKPRPLADYRGGPVGSLGSTYEYRAETREIDRRLAEVDTYVAGANSSLAREIEELR
ncbi:MAG TPA: PspC domain-containing protein [Allosphingosinicella sp.]|jgi:phage shock protein C|uniref:PspC domain-containing protein n=1 Tax=Allosphingosinicella sp. TaxID=2823234 RepID=UPI002F2A12BF